MFRSESFDERTVLFCRTSALKTYYVATTQAQHTTSFIGGHTTENRGFTRATPFLEQQLLSALRVVVVLCLAGSGGTALRTSPIPSTTLGPEGGTLPWISTP